jgi:hypothetical protein
LVDLNRLYIEFIEDPATAESAFWTAVTRFVNTITKDAAAVSIVLVKLVEAIDSY